MVPLPDKPDSRKEFLHPSAVNKFWSSNSLRTVSVIEIPSMSGDETAKQVRHVILASLTHCNDMLQMCYFSKNRSSISFKKQRFST